MKREDWVKRDLERTGGEWRTTGYNYFCNVLKYNYVIQDYLAVIDYYDYLELPTNLARLPPLDSD